MWTKLAIGAGALLLLGGVFYMLKKRTPAEPPAQPTPIPNYSTLATTTQNGTTSTGAVIQVANTKAETIATKQFATMSTAPAGATVVVPKIQK